MPGSAGSTWATATAASIVDAAYTSAGGSAIYAHNPLRVSGCALTQHFLVKPDTLTPAGALLLDQEIDLPLF